MPRWLVAMSKLKQPYKKPGRVLRELFEYLIGFIALAVFAGYAFAKGPPTEMRWLAAFKLGTAVGVLELGYLWFISRPANRLILGANLWLCAGGVAAFLEQWWWLKLYEKFGEASLFACILLAGIVSTVGSRSGFVGEIGPKTAVRSTSLILLASVVLALILAIAYKGDVKVAAVFPIIALSWLNRVLRVKVRSARLGC